MTAVERTLRIATNSGQIAAFKDEQLPELLMNLRGPLLRPGEPAYEESRVIFNGLFDRRPGAIVSARTTGDVIEAVNFAAANDLLLAVRGGGHSVAGKSMCDAGLVIDLRGLNGVFLDRRDDTVVVQGGATWGDVDAETQPFGLAVPSGVVSETGVAGLTLNGGVGWLRNKHGLTCDNLLAAEMVTADGRLVTASAQENPDLFWALRGGGGNFGIVTTFRFQAHPVGPIVQAAIPMYALEDAPTVLPKWRDWVVRQPDDVTSMALIWTVPEDPHMPEPVHDKRVLILASVYAGDPAKGEQAMEALRHLGTTVFDMSGPFPFRILQSAFDPMFPKTGKISSYWKSTYLKDLSDDTIDVIVDAGMNRTSEYSRIAVLPMGAGVTKVGRDDTAYLEREANFMISLDADWLDKGPGTEHITWSRQIWERLQPFATGGIYLNFLGEEGTDSEAAVRRAFGPHFDRLVDVKTKYDPTNLFRLNQNVRPRS